MSDARYYIVGENDVWLLHFKDTEHRDVTRRNAAVAGGVLQREQEPAGGRRVVAVIRTAPGVDVDHPIGRHHHLPRVTDIVGEHRCAKAGRQRDPAIVARAG